MINRRIVLGISIGVFIMAGIAYFLLPEKTENVTTSTTSEKQAVNEVDVTSKTVAKPTVKNKPSVKKADLYNYSDKNLPFSAIVDLAELSEGVKNTINNLLAESSGGIYFLKSSADKVFIVVDLTPEGEESPIKRHDFNFVEISLHDGSVINHIESEKDSQYDKWKYDGDLPLKHTHYNENKELVYTEVWTYDQEESVKYKKTDKDDNVISLRKEVVGNGTNLREEHLFYDKDGNMTQNVSFNYDGIDLTRFTYYNSQTPNDSVMISSEYEDGVKKKETVYSSDYKVKNIYLPEYNDGQKSEIKIFDKDNNLVETLVEE